MSDIPSEIVADFLSRVPARSLLRFRCVSKSWRAVIDRPDFIKMHLNRTIQANSDRKLILRSCYLHMADIDALEMTNKADYLELDHPLKRPDIGTEILGSCHGLVCLANSEKDMVLWNPTTRKHFKLPFSRFEFPKKSFYCTRSVVYGFGYDKVSDDYKVLRIVQFYDFETESRVKIFSMKSKCWRKIPCFPYYLKYKRAHAVFALGAFHWVVNRNPDSEMENLIASFDLGTEEYRLLSLPDDLNKEFHMNVVVLGESLCLMCNDYNSKHVDIWVMKEYAVKESWMKLFTVTELDFETKPFDYVTPVAYSRSGHQVYMVQNDNLPLWYDLQNRKIRGYSRFSSSSSFTNLIEHHVSFGSLVDLDGGISDSVGYAKGRKRGKGNQDTKKNSKKNRDGFMSKGFNMML